MSLPENVGRHAKRVDAALPGKHTRQLYDRLSWKEASVLAQLRTGMARLNGYLYRINAAETDQCDMRTSKRDRGALPLSMSEVDCTPDGYAAVYPHPPRKHILLI